MDKEIWTLKNQFNEDETITVGELGRLFGDLPDDFEIFSKAENSYLECGEWGGNISSVVVNLKKRRVCLVRGIE